MTKSVTVTRVQVLAAQGLIEPADMGVGEIDGRIRAIAAGTRIEGTSDYVAVYDPHESQPG